MADDTKNDSKPAPLTDAEVAQLRREQLTPPCGTLIPAEGVTLSEKTKVSWPVMVTLIVVSAFAVQTQFTAKAAEKTADAADAKVAQKADVTDLKAVVTDVTLLKIVTSRASNEGPCPAAWAAIAWLSAMASLPLFTRPRVRCGS